MRLTLLALWWSISIASVSVAAPTRVAIVYGHNGADGPRAPLRYAELDAARMAQTLTELGQVDPADLKLLQGRPIAELTQALHWAKERVAGRDAVLLVYLSAHADARRGLLPGKEALGWPELKAAIAATGATVRVTIVDGCQSAGIIEAGARAVPAFELEADPLTVKGEVFITTSAVDEPSVEAGAFQGSVFSQHLLAGLRGAADRSGDGRISLDEAYRYAFERTQGGATGQHAAFANRLSGYGELTLTSLERASGLVPPERAQVLTVREARSGSPLISVREPDRHRLALPPGRYDVVIERDGAVREGRVEVVPHQFVALADERLTASSRQPLVVRLVDSACVWVDVPRPDPLLQALADRLRTPPCDDGVEVTLTHAQGAVVISGKSRSSGVLSQTLAPGDLEQLTRACQRWLSDEASSLATKQKR